MDLIKLDQQFEGLKNGQRIIIRDDLYEFSDLQQIFEAASKKKIAIALLDTGRLSPGEIELLATFPFSFYTSDGTRPDFKELSLLNLVLKSKGCRLFYFLQGKLEENSELFHHGRLFHSIYLSNQGKILDLELVGRLAEEVTSFGTNLVYYHHGNLEEKLTEVSQKNSWIHVSNKNLREETEIMIEDMLNEITRAGGHLVIHVERSQSYQFLKLLADGGAFLVFHLPPVESSSRLSKLISRWQRKKLAEEAFYLYKEIMA
ncbi:MAG: hypothetical protein ACPLRA_03920 [Candidatus Saccharicenans sp.]